MNLQLRPPLTKKLDDKVAEEVRRDHAARITEIQTALPAIQEQTMVGGVVVANIQLPNATATKVGHSLGKVPKVLLSGVMRGATAAGVLVENERTSTSFTLTATGYGATITIDVVVA